MLVLVLVTVGGEMLQRLKVGGESGKVGVVAVVVLVVVVLVLALLVVLYFSCCYRGTSEARALAC